MRESAQDDFREVLDRDPGEGWRRFIDRYTPVLLAALERAGVTDRDEAMEIYVMACERLAASHAQRFASGTRAAGRSNRG